MYYKSVFAILALLFLAAIFWWPRGSELNFSHKTGIILIEGDVEYPQLVSNAPTVGEFLSEQKVTLSAGDSILPPTETPLTAGMQIQLVRERTFTVEIDGHTEEHTTKATSVGEALDELPLTLNEADIITPSKETALAADVTIDIVRVTISEEVEETSIAFKTEEKEDDELSWRKKVVEQKGEKGVLATKLRIARHDGKEVSRTILSKEVTKEPVTEIIKQGTLVKTGKSHSGGASWYAHTGTLSAANPWLPFGSYVRVTNTANGKSVIVKINDRGPFGGGRIIDLDKVAFQEIASLGQGVVNVKMEEITN
ncbi:MAG: G5 domain-containing protein [Patescibacteria group bacterium]